METFLVNYFDDLESIKHDWETIYKRSSLSYFCSLEWHNIVCVLYKKTFITKRLYSIKYFSLTTENDKNVVLVGFFYLSKLKREILFTHLLGPSDYYDFIYSPNFDKNLSSVIVSKIIKDIGVEKYKISHIKGDSLLYNFVLNNHKNNLKVLKCVSIKLPNSYEIYLQQLSKNSKQNLRTSLNRIRKNNLVIEFTLNNINHIDSIDFKNLKEIYNERNKHKNQQLSWKSKAYAKLDSLFSGYVDIFGIDDIKKTNFTLGIIKLNGRIAAYFFGFSRNNKIEINRVAICNEFKFFSPGILLFNEFVKKSIEEKLQVIDLTIGDEKYKYDLGGSVHEIFNLDNQI